tara:strand:+ start:1911 stop:2087 length:177 start_codon:yes stop_codon:yes gene_type:complete
MGAMSLGHFVQDTIKHLYINWCGEGMNEYIQLFFIFIAILIFIVKSMRVTFRKVKQDI